MTAATIEFHLLVRSGDGTSLLVEATDRTTPGMPIIRADLPDEEALVVAVRRHLEAAWELDAAVLETHLPDWEDGRASYRALAVLDGPPRAWPPPVGIDWRPLATAVGAPPDLAPRVEAWLSEWRAGAEPPALRPRWARPGWHADATSWITRSLEVAGRAAAGPIEVRRLWTISALLHVPTVDAGGAWFKAVFPHFHHEVAATGYIAAALPDAVPRILAADADRGWLLLDDAGAEPLGMECDDDGALVAAIEAVVAVQRSMIGHERALIGLGCPHRPLESLAEDVAAAIAEAPELEGPVVSPDRRDVVLDWVRRQAAWLGGIGLPETLVHGDFHPGNAIQAGGTVVLIDWSDAAIAHPILEIGPWFGHPGARGDRDRHWSAWLDALSTIGPVDPLRAERERAAGLAAAYQFVSYAGIVRNIEPANRYQLSDGLRDFWSLLEACVQATP